MKTSASVLLVSGIVALPGLLSAQTAGLPASEPDRAHGDPFTPVGSLTVTPTVVQPGVQPNMKWGIEYPKSIADLAIIVPPGRLVTTNEKTEKLSVRVAGASFSSNGTDLPVALWIRVGGSNWELLFYGRGPDVNPAEVVFEQPVESGTVVDFAARGVSATGASYTTRWTLANTPNIEALVHGDPLPSQSSAFSSGQTEGFMTQFVSDSNEVVAGPRDIVYVFELASDSPGDEYFDMQDIVTVVSMQKNNNGHGNNDDGFDVSNPGNSTGVGGVGDSIVGYNPDGTPIYGTTGFIDDERQKIRKK